MTPIRYLTSFFFLALLALGEWLGGSTSTQPPGTVADPALWWPDEVRDLTPLSGDPSRLTGNTVAIGKEMSGFEGYKVGDEIPLVFVDRTPVKLRVVAIVKDAFGLNPSLLIPLELARKHAPTAEPERQFGRFVVRDVADADKVQGGPGGSLVPVPDTTEAGQS